jgi:hypothetical protein
MDDNELKNIWKDYDRRLEEARVLNLQSWALNLQCFEALQRRKMQSKLGRLALFKIMVIVLGLPWTALLSYLFMHSLSWPRLFFSIPVSAGALFIFNLYAIAAYIQQLVLIRRINNSESIVDTQLRLAGLQSATLRVLRILFLQMPFYTTFLYSAAWIKGWSAWFWLSSVPVTGLFVLLALWLYRNIRYENAGRKWFRFLFNGPEWNYVVQSVTFIKEIEEFKQNI